MFKFIFHRSQNQEKVQSQAGQARCPLHGKEPFFMKVKMCGDSMVELSYKTCCADHLNLMRRSFLSIHRQTNYFFKDDKRATPKDWEIWCKHLKTWVEALICPDHQKHPDKVRLSLSPSGIHCEAGACCEILENLINELVKDDRP